MENPESQDLHHKAGFTAFPLPLRRVSQLGSRARQTNHSQRHSALHPTGLLAAAGCSATSVCQRTGGAASLAGPPATDLYGPAQL